MLLNDVTPGGTVYTSLICVEPVTAMSPALIGRVDDIITSFVFVTLTTCTFTVLIPAPLLSV